MIVTLRNLAHRFTILMLILFASWSSHAQTTAFSADFSTSTGDFYTTTNGPIGNSSTWSMLRSGTDMGARITGGILELSNDATGLLNNSGWVMAYATAGAAPYNTTLNANPGVVTWTFNMRQVRTNPSGLAAGKYGNAVILAGTANTSATAGSGYAVVLGQSGSIDPLRLVRYTAGLRTSSNIIASNTLGYGDFGANFLSVKVTYTPATGTWQLFVRNDDLLVALLSFLDPALGTLTSQGTAVNTLSTGTPLPLVGAFWNTGIAIAQTAYFDNIRIGVTLPALTSLSPPSKIAGSGQFTLTVNGTNLTAGSVVKFNGTNLVTTYVSATQLTAIVPASLITTAGTAAITVGTTTTSYSNSLPFTIEQANIPSIATSISALNAFSTVTGTASAFQSFTSTGTNLGANTITVTAPTNFEVSLTSGGTYTTSVTAPSATTPIYVRVKATAPAGIYNGGSVTLAATGAVTKSVAVNATVYALEPTTSPTLVTFTNTNSISTTVNWTNGNGSNHLVVVREASAVTALPVDGTSYSASGAFGAGSEVATGQYVAYNGTGNSVTLTGLNPATTYYVAVYDYNGAAGTENYKTTTPATGNKTTLNAPVGLQVTAANTEYKINFDTTVEGVNNGTYNSGGITPSPQTGELNSNAFAFTGFADGAVAFGGTSPEDSGSYENGTSTGDVTDGGLYAFQVADGNYALGFQPAAGEFSPGSTSFRFQNQTGSAVTSLSVGYKVWVRNNEAGSNSLSFSYSTDNSTYTPVTALTQTTDAAVDAVPGWKAYYKVVTITGLNVAANGYAYLRWTGTPVSGTAYDELAIDDISIVANPTTTFASFAGTAQTFVLAGNSNLAGDVTVLGDTNFVNGKVIVGSNTLTLGGTVTNTVTGGIRGSATSNVVVNGTANPTLSFDQTTVGTTNMLNNLSINTTAANTVTLGNNLTVSSTLTVDEGQTLNLGTSTLTGALSTIVNNGTVTTQNTTATPFASGKTWGGTGTVILNAATAAQTLVAGTYNKVTVSTTGGATATGNITLNGDLNLPNANVSAVKGSFDTGVYTLTMGANSANTGVGDVSGTITRNTIVANMQYTFGNPNTHLVIPPVGTLPTSMSLKTTLGVAPAGKTDGILRTYDFIQTGATGTKAIITAHYLDSELNGNIENKLVDWVVQVSPQVIIEQGRTNYDATQNFVELGNVNLAFFSSTFGQKLLTLANSQVTTATWNGSVSSSWTTAANWSPNAVPSDNTLVIIPDAATTPNDPILNPLVTIGKLSIETGGILNSPTGSQFIITGATGSWINNGTFNPSNGTVTFNSNATTNGDATIAGNTTFNNLVIPTGTTLRALTNNVMDIAGTFTKDGSFVAGAVNNTVIYSGTNQTVVTPNGAQSAYDNITITGTGAIFPTTLNVNGDITLNSAVSFAGKSILLTGTDNQAIGGTAAPVFNNVTVNKPSGVVMLTANTTVGGTLTLTSGLLDIDNYNLTLGATPIAGNFSATSMIVAEDIGVVRAPFTSTGSYFFPIGETTSNTSYSPITVNITSASGFSNAYVSVNVKDAVHPDNHSTSSYLTRYWNVTQTGIANAIATITANYIPGDAVGGEATLSAAQLNGAFNVQTNPWLKFNVLSGNTLTATNALLTSGVVSAFTGITAANIVALITGEGDVCQNSAIVLSADITAGDAPYYYFWSNSLGANATATPPTNTLGSTTYTLTVRDANGILSIDTAVVNVVAPPVGGTVNSSQVICASSTPNDVTLTGYTGNIIRWERSNTPDFAVSTPINSTSATLTGVQIGTGITSTKYIRAVVQNGPCDAVYSSYITISINSTIWNGTSWSDGVPTDGYTAIFTGNFTATANIYACSVVVNNNASVIIPTGFNAVVTGTVTVNSGSFVVENNAALVQINNVSNLGNVTVKKNSNPLYRLDYTMWSSPVAGQQIGSFSPWTNPSRFYVYGGLNSSNVYADQYFVVPDLTAIFQKATGYLIRMPNSITGGPTGTYYAGTSTYSYPGVFTGVPNNGVIYKTLNTQGNRYTATGNPYASPISVYEFFTQNAAVLDDDSGIYFWRKKNDHTVSSYATLTLAGLVANGATPDANSTTEQDPDYEFGGQDQAIYYQGNNQNWVVSPGQGFVVRADAAAVNPQLAFRNNMRKLAPLSGNLPFFRTADANPMSRLWLNLTGTDAFSQTAIAYIDGATLGIDYSYDGKKLSDSGNAELYTTVEQSNMAIQARPAFNATDIVPLNFMAVSPGNYQLAIDHMDGVFEDGQEVYLIDKLMGVTHNIKEAAYNFTTDAGTFTNRFDVIYSKTLGIDNPALAANNVIIYKEGKQLKVTSGQNITHVVAFDLTGRNIYNQEDINANSFSSNPINIAQQVIVVTVTLENGKTVSKKIIFD